MDPIKTKIIHSKSKNAWNVVGTTLGGKFKIASFPYPAESGTDKETLSINKATKNEAYKLAKFVKFCLGNTTVTALSNENKEDKIMHNSTITPYARKELIRILADHSMNKLANLTDPQLHELWLIDCGYKNPYNTHKGK